MLLENICTYNFTLDTLYWAITIKEMVYKAPELIEVWTELEYLKMTMQKPYLWMFKGFMFNIINALGIIN